MVVKAMVRVQADEAMSEILCQVEGRVELVDEQGKILGYFNRATPEEDVDYVDAARQFDSEEIQRRKLDLEPGYSTSEVQERLRSLGNP